uniref:DNA polymerase III subunit gamma/tau C-terminal domain-containing protein n=1 Tax=Microbulbifer taiwanensis TaxID=986746 RepID=UPI0029C03149
GGPDPPPPTPRASPAADPPAPRVRESAPVQAPADPVISVQTAEVAEEKKPQAEERPTEVGAPAVDDTPPWEPPRAEVVQAPEPAAVAEAVEASVAHEPQPQQPAVEAARPAPQPEADPRVAMREQLRQQVAQVESTPVQHQQPQPQPKPAVEKTASAHLDALTPGSWPALYSQLGISGILHSIAFHLELVGRQDNILSYTLDESYSSLYDEVHQRRLADLLADFFQQPVTVQIQVGEVQGTTPARLAAATREARLAAARDALSADPLVQELQRELGAELQPDSVESLADAE